MSIKFSQQQQIARSNKDNEMQQPSRHFASVHCLNVEQIKVKLQALVLLEDIAYIIMENIMHNNRVRAVSERLTD